MRRLLSFLLVSALLLALPGCAGYHIGSIQPTFMKDVKSIAVPVFRNETLIPHIEALATNALIRQMQQDGTYTIAGMNDADAVLECSISKIDRHSVRSLRENVLATSEFNLVVTITYKLTRRATGESLDSRSITGQASFFVSSDIQQDEQQALPIAVSDASARLVSAISEGW